MPPWALKWAVPVAGYLLAAILGWRLLSAHERIGEIETRLDVQVAQTLEVADANDVNVATIAELKATITDLINQRRADEARAQAEIEARERAVIAARGEAERLRRERDELIRGDPTCEAHSQQVLADSCPAIAGRLRERSAGTDRHED